MFSSTLPILAQASSENSAAPAVAAGVGVVIVLVALTVGIAIYLVLALTMSKALKSLPAAAQKCNPIFPWLIIIPLAGLVFNIICLLQIPASFIAHFGENDAESKSAKTLGLVSAIALGCCIIPVLNLLAGPTYLICLILFLVKISALGKRAAAQA